MFNTFLKKANVDILNCIGFFCIFSSGCIPYKEDFVQKCNLFNNSRQSHINLSNNSETG